MRISLYLSIVFSVILLFPSCGSKVYSTCEGSVWNTLYHITYCGDADFSDSIRSVLRKVEMSVSAFNKESVVSKINRNADMTVDHGFKEVYDMSRAVWECSDGAFDPTLAPLINAYGFGYTDSIHVNKSVIDSIHKYEGLGKTAITPDGRMQKADPRMEFNFSAIAKGYGCDRVAEMFENNGISDFMIEIGGEIVVRGLNPHGEKWNISVDRPVFSKDMAMHESQTVVTLTNCGIATSGNYRNYKGSGDKRFGHTVDPLTGKPAINDLASATVIAPTCMEADAYATACMAMGARRAKNMIQEADLPALLIFTDGTVWQTPAFKDLVVK